jgi:hypothetical protein
VPLAVQTLKAGCVSIELSSFEGWRRLAQVGEHGTCKVSCIHGAACCAFRIPASALTVSSTE